MSGCNCSQLAFSIKNLLDSQSVWKILKSIVATNAKNFKKFRVRVTFSEKAQPTETAHKECLNVLKEGSWKVAWKGARTRCILKRIKNQSCSAPPPTRTQTRLKQQLNNNSLATTEYCPTS